MSTSVVILASWPRLIDKVALDPVAITPTTKGIMLSQTPWVKGKDDAG